MRGALDILRRWLRRLGIAAVLLAVLATKKPTTASGVIQPMICW
jgi:hypothetical protein